LLDPLSRSLLEQVVDGEVGEDGAKVSSSVVAVAMEIALVKAMAAAGDSERVSSGRGFSLVMPEEDVVVVDVVVFLARKGNERDRVKDFVRDKDSDFDQD